MDLMSILGMRKLPQHTFHNIAQGPQLKLTMAGRGPATQPPRVGAANDSLLADARTPGGRATPGHGECYFEISDTQISAVSAACLKNKNPRSEIEGFRYSGSSGETR